MPIHDHKGRNPITGPGELGGYPGELPQEPTQAEIEAFKAALEEELSAKAAAAEKEDGEAKKRIIREQARKAVRVETGHRFEIRETRIESPRVERRTLAAFGEGPREGEPSLKVEGRIAGPGNVLPVFRETAEPEAGHRKVEASGGTGGKREFAGRDGEPEETHPDESPVLLRFHNSEEAGVHPLPGSVSAKTDRPFGRLLVKAEATSEPPAIRVSSQPGLVPPKRIGDADPHLPAVTRTGQRIAEVFRPRKSGPSFHERSAFATTGVPFSTRGKVFTHGEAAILEPETPLEPAKGTPSDEIPDSVPTSVVHSTSHPAIDIAVNSIPSPAIDAAVEPIMGPIIHPIADPIIDPVFSPVFGPVAAAGVNHESVRVSSRKLEGIPDANPQSVPNPRRELFREDVLETDSNPLPDPELIPALVPEPVRLSVGGRKQGSTGEFSGDPGVSAAEIHPPEESLEKEEAPETTVLARQNHAFLEARRSSVSEFDLPGNPRPEPHRRQVVGAVTGTESRGTGRRERGESPWEDNAQGAWTVRGDEKRAGEIEAEKQERIPDPVFESAAFRMHLPGESAPQSEAHVRIPVGPGNTTPLSQEVLSMVDRFLVTAEPGAYVKEVRLTLNDSVLPNTEVRFRQVGNSLVVTLVSEDEESADRLRAEAPDLAEALRGGSGDEVEVRVVTGVGAGAGEG